MALSRGGFTEIGCFLLDLSDTLLEKTNNGGVLKVGTTKDSRADCSLDLGSKLFILLLKRSKMLPMAFPPPERTVNEFNSQDEDFAFYHRAQETNTALCTFALTSKFTETYLRRVFPAYASARGL